MRKVNFSDEFKRDAVAQITERGYPVAEVSQRLGVTSTRCMLGRRSSLGLLAAMISMPRPGD